MEIGPTRRAQSSIIQSDTRCGVVLLRVIGQRITLRTLSKGWDRRQVLPFLGSVGYAVFISVARPREKGDYPAFTGTRKWDFLRGVALLFMAGTIRLVGVCVPPFLSRGGVGCSNVCRQERTYIVCRIMPSIREQWGAWTQLLCTQGDVFRFWRAI